uniref:Uncharacterized protein n=1 Tax=Noctiluca scintillans TaxID=2966 RepID=A0A7S1FHM5_NOCSC|mmetsp:Transcript_6506/g.18238  ORF Transcript_6506/g.18238 Transcript_6506/m.18238 type:complete len:126 (+) Transcript_6506:70-447(+)
MTHFAADMELDFLTYSSAPVRCEVDTTRKNNKRMIGKMLLGLPILPGLRQETIACDEPYSQSPRLCHWNDSRGSSACKKNDGDSLDMLMSESGSRGVRRARVCDSRSAGPRSDVASGRDHFYKPG